MSHTAEPWCVGNTRTVKYATGESTETAIHYGDEESRGNCIAMTYGHFGFDGSEADARRIVACVNACAGIPTDDLEHGDIAKALKIFALDSATFRRQRDELLAALEYCRAVFDEYIGIHLDKTPPDYDKAARNENHRAACDAAITNVKGSAA